MLLPLLPSIGSIAGTRVLARKIQVVYSYSSVRSKRGVAVMRNPDFALLGVYPRLPLGVKGGATFSCASGLLLCAHELRMLWRMLLERLKVEDVLEEVVWSSPIQL